MKIVNARSSVLHFTQCPRCSKHKRPRRASVSRAYSAVCARSAAASIPAQLHTKIVNAQSSVLSFHTIPPLQQAPRPRRVSVSCAHSALCARSAAASVPLPVCIANVRAPVSINHTVPRMQQPPTQARIYELRCMWNAYFSFPVHRNQCSIFTRFPDHASFTGSGCL
jgi:hypothetical protein